MKEALPSVFPATHLHMSSPASGSWPTRPTQPAPTRPSAQRRPARPVGARGPSPALPDHAGPRSPLAPRRGAAGCFWVLLIDQHLYRWSYAETVARVADSLVLCL